MVFSVCLPMVVASPKPFMGAATFSFSNNQTRYSASVHSMKSSQQATKHGTRHPVRPLKPQPNTVACTLSTVLILAGMTPSSWTKTTGAINHALMRLPDVGGRLDLHTLGPLVSDRSWVKLHFLASLATLCLCERKTRISIAFRCRSWKTAPGATAESIPNGPSYLSIPRWPGPLRESLAIDSSYLLMSWRDPPF